MGACCKRQGATRRAGLAGRRTEDIRSHRLGAAGTGGRSLPLSAAPWVEATMHRGGRDAEGGNRGVTDTQRTRDAATVIRLDPLVWEMRAEGSDGVHLVLPWDEALANPDGVLHGGAIAASLEEAARRLAQRLWEGSPGQAVRPVVVERRIAFEAAGRGPVFEVRARPLRVGRRAAFLEGELTDAVGTVCARLSAVALRFPADPVPLPGVSNHGMEEDGPASPPGSHRLHPDRGEGRLPPSTVRPEVLRRANPYRDALGADLSLPQVGESAFRLRLQPSQRASDGTVHMGALLGLVDLGMGHALLAGAPEVERPITLMLAADTPMPCRTAWVVGSGRLLDGWAPTSPGGSDGFFTLCATVRDPGGRVVLRARGLFQGRGQGGMQSGVGDPQP